MSKPATLEREEMNFEPKPGTTYKAISEEVQCLSEFMSMMKKKVELEKQYLTALKALQATWNPKWSDTGIYPLLYPMLNCLNDEVAARAEANKYIISLVDDFNLTSPLNSVEVGGFDPADLPQCLEHSYQSYLLCHEIISDPQVVKQLQIWYTRMQSSLQWKTIDRDDLPEQDRNYRKAVIQQQRSVEPAIKWYDEKITDILEHHQQRAEDFKKFLHRMLNTASGVSLQLSTSYATTINGTASFSSTDFVATHHGAAGKERSHTLVQPKQYYNYYLDGRVARPLFGLGPGETIALLQQIAAWTMNNHQNLNDLENVDIGTAFELEVSALSESIPNEGFRKDKLREMKCLLMCSLCLDKPLIPLSNEEVRKHEDFTSVPRNKLRSMLKGINSKNRPTIISLLCQFVILMGNYDSAIAFSHDDRAAAIILDICIKWDFENDRPLPNGFLRSWNSENRQFEIAPK